MTSLILYFLHGLKGPFLKCEEKNGAKKKTQYDMFKINCTNINKP
jgi:hypothetical protein